MTKVGFGDVLTQTPRTEILVGTPREVTFAQSIAPVAVRLFDVGIVIVGIILVASPKRPKTEKCVVVHVTLRSSVSTIQFGSGLQLSPSQLYI